MAVKAGERCLVLNDEKRNIQMGEAFRKITFPDTVVLSQPMVEGDFCDIMITSTGSDMFDLMTDFSNTEFRIEIYGESSQGRIYYTSEDGETYYLSEARLDDMNTGEFQGGPEIDFGRELIIDYASDERPLQFFPTRVIEFGGIYIAESSGDKLYWATQPLGLTLQAKDVVAGAMALTDDGFVEGCFGQIDNIEDIKKFSKAMYGIGDFTTNSLNSLFYQSTDNQLNITKLLNVSGTTDFEKFASYCENITTLDVSGWKLDTAAETASSISFRDFASFCPNLEAIDGFVETFNQMKDSPTSGITLMNAFTYDHKLAMDLTDLDVSKVANLSWAFSYCPLITMDVSKWDTSKNYDFTRTFAGGGYNSSGRDYYYSGPNITGYENLSFDVCNNITHMFSGNDYLIDFTLRNKDMSECSFANNFLSNCPNLKSIDITNMTIGGQYNQYGTTIGNFSYAFAYNPKLETFEATGFTGGYFHNFKGMFYNDSSLKTIIMPNFNPSNKTNKISMVSAFEGCTSLELIDMRSFDWHNINGITNMFKGVPNDCIIVATEYTKGMIQSHNSNLTNVMTAEEYEAM